MSDAYIFTPPPAPAPVKRLTTAQFAKRLGLSQERIYSLIREGVIEEDFVFQAGQRRLLIDVAALADVRRKRKARKAK